MKAESHKGCPLCCVEKQIILSESELWYWIASLSPYWEYHTMFIPKRHVEKFIDLSVEELIDLKNLYKKAHQHVTSLQLKHKSGRSIDQFIFMLRVREKDIPDGSEYLKPNHLHIHYAPDEAGVRRLVIDDDAINWDVELFKIH